MCSNQCTKSKVNWGEKKVTNWIFKGISKRQDEERTNWCTKYSQAGIREAFQGTWQVSFQSEIQTKYQ